MGLRKGSLPRSFWDIRVPGNQFTTEVLLVGLEQDHRPVMNYLDSHAAAQRGQVYAQLVPTGQDSVILISRVAHLAREGGAYYRFGGRPWLTAATDD